MSVSDQVQPLKRPSIGDYLIARLRDSGIDDVFRIPGDYVVSFYTELERSPINASVAREKIALGLPRMLALK